jgi:two-component system, OmpR family, sensor histidine kinase QseC
MTRSIRRFLFVCSLTVLTVSSIFTATGDYYLRQREIFHHLDNLLYYTATSVYALIGRVPSEIHLEHLQKNLYNLLINSPPLPTKEHQPQIGTFGNIDTTTNHFFNDFKNKYQFQVWGKNNELLLHSAAAPKSSLIGPENGFHEKTVEEQTWRVFTLVEKESGMRFVAAILKEEYEELASGIDTKSIYFFLFIYALSALLIWLTIGYSLNSLKRMAKEIANRTPDRLDPVHLDSVPSEIKPLVEELNHLFIQLQHALDREQRFAADAAHELRTPLAAIKTQAQVALHAITSPEQRNTINNVINGVDRCTHIVRQLLTLSRLAPGSQYPADITKVSVLKLITEVVSQLHASTIEHKTTIELITPDPTITIDTDETILGMLIRNLIDNAIRYTPVGSHIQIAALRDAGRIILQVRDNGPGIPDELHSRVFERFYRVLGNKTTGSGLGLAIVQHIARLFEGDVALGAPPSGTGLEVTVSFPDKQK